MAITHRSTAGSVQELLTDATKESTATAGQAGLVVVNPDGSSIATTGATGSPTAVQGIVASGAADSGNPVKAGGVFNSTLPTLTNGQRADLQTDAKGRLITASEGPNGSPFPANVTWIGATYGANMNAASMAGNIGDNTTGSSQIAVVTSVSNGSSFDFQRNNMNTTVGITASGVTTSQTGADQTNFNGRGVKVVLDMTSVGTGSVTLEIDGKDNASGKYYAILTGTAVTTNSTNVYTVYPGITTAANAAVSDVLPRTWRVKATANNANPATYTVGASVIL